MLNFITARLRPVHKLLITGAWFFIIVSLLNVAWAVGMLVEGSPESVTLYSSQNGADTFEAWGLTYTGTSGLVHALAQILAIMVAASASTLKPRTKRLFKWRRAGHFALAVWAGWWAVNMFALASFEGSIYAMLLASFTTVLFGCTGYRTVHAWCTQRCQNIESIPEDDEPAIKPSPVEPVTDLAPLKYSPSPTHAFFAAIAPPPPPVAEKFKVEITVSSETEAKPSIFTKFLQRLRGGQAKVRQHVNRENIAHFKDKANHAAHQGHAFVKRNAGRFARHARRAKPVAQTAIREAKHAWRKTLDSLKKAEQMKTNDVGVPSEKVA